MHKVAEVMRKVVSEMELVFISDRHSTAPHSTARLFLYLSSSREALSVLLLWLFDWIKSGQ